MRYLITGHTGFKGSWLASMLTMQGHEVVGISLPPLENSLYRRANLHDLFHSEYFIDIRERDSFKKAIQESRVEVAFHLAAQPLVRESYETPIETYETNVLGTLNFLEGVRDSDIQAAIVITTDKVYKDKQFSRGYKETDELGGHDPYSSSKAAADLATQSWVASFECKNISVARAGNVIGGGDWAKDRIIPDLVRSFEKKIPARIRNPRAIRPWQHVADCLTGYVALSNSMLNSGTTGEWNFGPVIDFDSTVSKIVDLAVKFWGESAHWEIDDAPSLHETSQLLLDSSKAKEHLGWSDKLDLETNVEWTINFHRDVAKGVLPRKLFQEQVRKFLSL